VSLAPRRRGRLRLAAVSLLGCFSLVAVAPTDAAVPVPVAQVSEAQVFTALGVDQVVADYIVVVDTSGSMQASGLYGQVKVALQPLLDALAPTDHLSLITFDTTPTLRYSGAVGTPGDRALAQLQPAAEGQDTDIGSAIGEALSELERPSASPIGTIILLTDGQHDPGSGSAYPTTSGPTWTALTQRARAVEVHHSLNAYALSLEPVTDAALLQQVVDNSLIVNLPPNQIGPYFDDLKNKVRLAKARAVLGDDPMGNVTASWSGAGLDNLNLNHGTGRATLTLHSTEAHLPLVLTGLAAHSQGLTTQVTGLPASVTLAPGQTVSLPVTLTTTKAGGFDWGRHAVTETGSLSTSAQVQSPWADVLSQSLNEPLKVTLAGSPTAVRARGIVGWTWMSILITPILLLLLVAFAVAWKRSREPRLHGVLVATPPGQAPVRSNALSGRRVAIGSARGSRLKIPGAGDVRGQRLARPGKGKGFDLGLHIRYSANGKARRSGSCRPSTSAVIDGVTFTYQPGRS
jgi:Mg-chelatase subunit ChlD